MCIFWFYPVEKRHSSGLDQRCSLAHPLSFMVPLWKVLYSILYLHILRLSHLKMLQARPSVLMFLYESEYEKCITFLGIWNVIAVFMILPSLLFLFQRVCVYNMDWQNVAVFILKKKSICHMWYMLFLNINTSNWNQKLLFTYIIINNVLILGREGILSYVHKIRIKMYYPTAN